MRKIFLLLMILTLLITGCSKQQADDGKLQVTSSFYPMAEFARAVGGDKVQVTTLVPDGAEPHDWEPSPRDLTKIGRSRIFIYNGIVEPWAEQALEALSERQLVAVEAGRDLYNREGKADPHVWISPRKAIIEVQHITDALCAADEANASYYRKNSADYIARLQKLDGELAQVAADAPKKVFVTAHAAFGHLASDYGLTQLAVKGMSTESEPTPSDLQQLVRIVRREGVRYIFFETLTDPKIAWIIADETGAQTAVLDPLEGLNAEGRRQGLNYLTIMQRNIDNLNRALNDK